jgi:hypothetical protein
VKSRTLLSPLRRGLFQLLWTEIGTSYAGDRLQELAQAWLVATLTESSALAVGGISILFSLPQLLMPVGGAVADYVDRRRLFIIEQLRGGVALDQFGEKFVQGSRSKRHPSTYGGC